MKFNSEDLPDPEHPIMAHACFLWNVPLTFLKIRFFSETNTLIVLMFICLLGRSTSGIQTMVDKLSTDKVIYVSQNKENGENV